MPAMSLTSLLSRIPVPTAAVQRGLAIAAVVTQGGIAVTGSVVRVTGSGLGCASWPQCEPGSFTPVSEPPLGHLHQWVEFGNRMLTGVVGLVAIACLLAAWLARPRRRRQVLLAATMPVGVAVQAVLGGVTVLTGLLWWTVAAHLVLSMVLVWLAVLLVRAAGEGDEPARPMVSAYARALMLSLIALLTVLLVAGTFVTAAGPHAGDARTPRLMVPVETLAHIHAAVLYVFLGVLVLLGLALRASGADTKVRRPYLILLLVVVAQGSIGLVQFATGVPEALVSLHVLGAVLVVVCCATLWAATRDRGPLPSPGLPPAESLTLAA